MLRHIFNIGGDKDNFLSKTFYEKIKDEEDHLPKPKIVELYQIIAIECNLKNF